VSLVGFQAENHPQQVETRGPLDPIDDRATPPEFFEAMHARFRFTVDVAAAAHNTKLPRFYDYEANGLAQSWAGERVWCNPPYSDLLPWVRKAHREHRHAEVVVMLLPANRTEQAWWQTYVEPFRDRPGTLLRTEFIRGRLRFIKAGAESVEANNRPPFGVVLLIWGESAPSLNAEARCPEAAASVGAQNAFAFPSEVR
jgi:phage N-6-adenine-methyltransferase